jgi:hypothetical protein
MVTGYPDSEILDRILEVSPVTVLKKPLNLGQLNQAVKIFVHNGPSWRAEQQSSKPLVGLLVRRVAQACLRDRNRWTACFL